MKQIIDKFNDGGPFFMYAILVLLIIIVALFIKGLVDKKEYGKRIELIKSLGWFTIVWGFLGVTFGLSVAFDNVSAHGELTPALLADGLKMALLNPLFAIIVFLIARLGIIILISMQRAEEFA